MLQIDQRIGSGELAKFLAMMKLPIEVTTLGFGDFAFLGRGEGEMPVPVGIERKAIADFVSSVWTGRFAGHQLLGLLQCFQVIYVVLEGLWRVNIQTGLIEVWGVIKIGPKKGQQGWIDLEVGGKTVLYRDLEQHLYTYEMKGGVYIRQTRNKPETCRFIGALYHWWTDKAWDEHKSHLKFRTVDADKAILIPMDPGNPKHLVRLMCKELKLVGWEKARAIAEVFPSMDAALCATVKEWQAIPGIGPTLAKRIWGVLHGVNGM